MPVEPLRMRRGVSRGRSMLRLESRARAIAGPARSPSQIRRSGAGHRSPHPRTHGQAPGARRCRGQASPRRDAAGHRGSRCRPGGQVMGAPAKFLVQVAAVGDGSRWVAVADFAAASLACPRFIEANDLGASAWRGGRVVDARQARGLRPDLPVARGRALVHRDPELHAHLRPRAGSREDGPRRCRGPEARHPCAPAHTFGSRLARRGVGLVEVQRLMGHSDPKLTAQVYTHLDVEDLRRAVEAV